MLRAEKEKEEADKSLKDSSESVAISAAYAALAASENEEQQRVLNLNALFLQILDARPDSSVKKVLRLPSFENREQLVSVLQCEGVPQGIELDEDKFLNMAKAFRGLLHRYGSCSSIYFLSCWPSMQGRKQH